MPVDVSVFVATSLGEGKGVAVGVGVPVSSLAGLGIRAQVGDPSLLPASIASAASASRTSGGSPQRTLANLLQPASVDRPATSRRMARTSDLSNTPSQFTSPRIEATALSGSALPWARMLDPPAVMTPASATAVSEATTMSQGDLRRRMHYQLSE